MSLSFRVVIPARYASSRLPGKPLMDIAGKPMIQHVYQRAMESKAQAVIIATDDQRIADAATAFGADVCMTSATHNSGTDRLAEVARLRGFSDQDIVVNVQGDEPCLPAQLINQVAEDLSIHHEAAIASLYVPITDKQEIFDPNVVKVVTDAQGYARYFSRAPIPWLRNYFATDQVFPEPLPHKRHIGLYGYRCRFLHQYNSLEPCMPEQAESLEQLRAIFYGYHIHMTEAAVAAGHGVDTERDLAIVRQLLDK